jgi:hypothetical protein
MRVPRHGVTMNPIVHAMRVAFVQEASLALDGDADRQAPGAAVTVALSGHWEHAAPSLAASDGHLGAPGHTELSGDTKSLSAAWYAW